MLPTLSFFREVGISDVDQHPQHVEVPSGDHCFMVAVWFSCLCCVFGCWPSLLCSVLAIYYASAVSPCKACTCISVSLQECLCLCMVDIVPLHYSIFNYLFHLPVLLFAPYILPSFWSPLYSLQYLSIHNLPLSHHNHLYCTFLFLLILTLPSLLVPNVFCHLFLLLSLAPFTFFVLK